MKISDIIKQHVGQTDMNNITDFPDRVFKQKMVDAGWKPKIRWCCYFAKMVWREYYKNDPAILTVLDMIFADNVVKTFRNFEDNEMFTISKTPVEGAIAMYEWVGVKRKETGTTFMVTEVDDKFFKTTELHYDSGSLYVRESKRKMNKPSNNTGLNLMGFIHPIIK